MAWTHYTYGRSRLDPAPRFRPDAPRCTPARRLSELLEESTGLARAGATAACWDGETAAIVQVHIAGTDIEGRPLSEVRIRERPADANAFAGSCLALFHKRPIESEAEWDHATLEIADRGHDRLAAPTLSGLAQLWLPTRGAALATVPAPTIGAREEAADVCLVIRALLALSGMHGPVVVAHSARAFAQQWASDKWLTVLVASDAAPEPGPSSYAHVERFLRSNPNGFSELAYYGDKLLEPPSLERLQRAVFVASAVEESAKRTEEGPVLVDLPRLVELQRRTEHRSVPRVWEVIRTQMHALVASDQFGPATDAPTRVHGYVGDSLNVIVELGRSDLESIDRVRDLLGARVAEQIRAAIEERLPVDDAIMSASKTVAQQSNHVIKLRITREPDQVIAEVRALPPAAPRRAELADLICELLERAAPLDMFIAARRAPEDRIADGLATLGPKWGGPPEALHRPVAELDAEWLVDNGEAILMTARRVGAEAFGFWVPILVEAVLRSMRPPPRLIEALLRTNLVALDDAAALIRHSTSATDYVRQKALELWTSGHRLMGLEPWLARPTKPLLEEAWELLPEPVEDIPPEPKTLADPLATLLWGCAARIRHGRPTLSWARLAGRLVNNPPDIAPVRALLHHGATWLPFARDLWLGGHGRLLEGVPFDPSHLEYIARDIQSDEDVVESNLLAPGTPNAMAELAAERLIPWLRAHRWQAGEVSASVEAVVAAWGSGDEGDRRAVHRYAWSMLAARAKIPRAELLDAAWRKWSERADEPSIQFVRSFPPYLQLELVALGHIALAEVEIMTKTSLPLINVLLVRDGDYEPAVLYEIPVASTWSLVIALPPGIEMPEEVVHAAGEQLEVLQAAATALDELAMPFTLGVWNHSAMAWKEGRHAWVSPDGRVVCLNTDREPGWYEPMQAGFGPEPTQRMLAAAAAIEAPDEMLQTVPRARVVQSRGRAAGARSLDFRGGPARVLVGIGLALLVIFALGYGAMFVFGGEDSAPTEGHAESSNGRPEETASVPPDEPAGPTCPFEVEDPCAGLEAEYPGAATYCAHAIRDANPYAALAKDPSQGPRCLGRRSAKSNVQGYYDRYRREQAVLTERLGELRTAACEAYVKRGCGEGGCRDIGSNLRAAIVDLLAKRFARSLHNKTADQAVPSLAGAMPYNIMDPKKKNATAWLKTAMSVSCAWRIATDADPTLAKAERTIARDFDRLKEKLGPHEASITRLKRAP